MQRYLLKLKNDQFHIEYKKKKKCQENKTDVLNVHCFFQLNSAPFGWAITVVGTSHGS